MTEESTSIEQVQTDELETNLMGEAGKQRRFAKILEEKV